MLVILNSLNSNNLPIFQPILIILVSKCMVHRALSDKTYLSLGLLSPLRVKCSIIHATEPLSLQNHCTRKALSSRVGCNRRVHR